MSTAERIKAIQAEADQIARQGVADIVAAAERLAQEALDLSKTKSAGIPTGINDELVRMHRSLALHVEAIRMIQKGQEARI